MCTIYSYNSNNTKSQISLPSVYSQPPTNSSSTYQTFPFRSLFLGNPQFNPSIISFLPSQTLLPLWITRSDNILRFQFLILITCWRGDIPSTKPTGFWVIDHRFSQGYIEWCFRGVERCVGGGDGRRSCSAVFEKQEWGA